jgi:trehalose-phosphatase
VGEVRSMVAVEGTVAFGSHGLEGGFEPGGDVQRELPEGLLERLNELESESIDLTSEFSGARIERKPAGLAFHDRLVEESRLADWRSRLTAWLDSKNLDGLVRLEGKRVLELRPEGFDKGRVVRIVLRRLGFDGRDISLVAVGDDRTDEDMFREIRHRGLPVLVSEQGRESHAARRIATPQEVGEFLFELAGG